MKQLELPEPEIVANRRSHYQEFVNDMPYKDKVFWAKQKIKEFFKECNKRKINEVTVSFSGGKDSTVLLDLVLKVHKEMQLKIKVVMIYATEITFPSTMKFIKHINQKYQKEYEYLADVTIVSPKKSWVEILSQNGYPIYSKQVSTMINRVKRAKTKNSLTKWFFGIDLDISDTAKFKLSKNRLFLLDDKMLAEWPDISSDQAMVEYFTKYQDKYFFSEKCCDFIKGNVKHDKRPSFIGTMAEESQLRKKSWVQHGCNIFSKEAMKSRPLSIWKQRDIWKYIQDNDLEINEAYGFDKTKPLAEQKLRFTRLGCTSCPYGSAIEDKFVEKIRELKIDNGYEKLNRFEILKQDYPNLYKSQVIANGMYKILIDMGVRIRTDDLYKKLYEMRHQQIEGWYSKDCYRKNILRVMCQIENFDDYKNKGEAYVWHYSLDEFNQSMKYFEFKQTNQKEVNKYRKEIRNYYSKNNISIKNKL